MSQIQYDSCVSGDAGPSHSDGPSFVLYSVQVMARRRPAIWEHCRGLLMGDLGRFNRILARLDSLGDVRLTRHGDETDHFRGRHRAKTYGHQVQQ